MDVMPVKMLDSRKLSKLEDEMQDHFFENIKLSGGNGPIFDEGQKCWNTTIQMKNFEKAVKLPS